MSDNAEYNQLVSEKTSAESQYSACEGRIEDCEYLLRRLRAAKRSITELKGEFKTNKKLDKKLHEESHDWKGSTYNSFSSKMETLREENENYYKHSIDHILDSLNNEITNVENRHMQEYGLLGQLGSWINSLANKIENFFN